MAEIATLARPYAEALFKVAHPEFRQSIGEQVSALATVASHPQMRQFADDPKASPQQVVDVLVGVANLPLAAVVRNLLTVLIENGRLVALPEISAQYHALMNQQVGMADATIYSAFPIDDAQLPDVVASLEQRFGRKLSATVVVDPQLIGGIRAVVGDEVLDASVRARLDRMKYALTA